MLHIPFSRSFHVCFEFSELWMKSSKEITEMQFNSTTPAIMENLILKLEHLHWTSTFMKTSWKADWRRCGRRLTNFKLESAVLTSQVMSELLRHVPDLEELTLSFWCPYDCTDIPIADSSIGCVRLDKPKKLSVDIDWNAFQVIVNQERLWNLENRWAEYHWWKHNRLFCSTVL